MKQNRDIDRVWERDLPVWRRWLAGPIRWVGLLCGLLFSGGTLLLANELSLVWQIALWIVAGLFAISMLLIIMKRRSIQRSWRQDDSVFEPSPGRSLSPLYAEQEWSLPSHPFIRYPLSLILIWAMYWMLVVHQMKLPGHFLVALVVLVVVSLWCWREPLLLVLMVIIGVALLSLISWMTSLPLPVILATVAVLGLGLGLGLLALHRRK